MRLAYLPTNGAWCIIFGDSIISLYDRSGFVGRLFDSRAHAVAALRLCGLTLNGNEIREA